MSSSLSTRLMLLVLAPLLHGCAPIIAHGPDVHPGFSGGVSAVLGNGPTYENGDDPGPFYFGATLASLAYGIRSASAARPAFRFGLQAPTAGGLAIDLYTQAPQKWLGPVDAGIGLLAEFSDGRQMPYVQAGIKSNDGFGLNAVVGRYWNTDARAGYTLRERAQVNWLTFEAPLSRWASLHFHGGFAWGHVTKNFDRVPESYVDENRWVKLGGASLELHR